MSIIRAAVDGEVHDPMQTKAAAENELLTMEKSLEQLQSLNNRLIHSNQEKDDTLTMKEEQLSTLKETQKDERDQMDLEWSCMTEKVEHDTLELNHQLKKEREAARRYKELEEESNAIEQGIEDTLLGMADQDRAHAAAMHDLKVSIKEVRQSMENEYRRQLQAMDYKYQNEAFSALNDMQKKTLLLNAKLKDEVGLQTIGLANMNVRLVRERLSYTQSINLLEKAEKLALSLRTGIEHLRSEKSDRQTRIEEYEENIRDLRSQYNTMQMQLSIWPSDEGIETALAECNDKLSDIAKECVVWKRRLENVRKIEEDLTVIPELNSNSKTKKKEQNKNLRSPSLSESHSQNHSTYSSKDKYDMNEVQNLMSSDSAYHEATKGFLDRTSLLLAGSGKFIL